MTQTDAWLQTCKLSKSSPTVHAANFGERHPAPAEKAGVVHRMVEEHANLCDVRFVLSASSGIPVVVRLKTLQARLLRAAEAMREAAFVMFDRQTWSPTTTLEACDLLREARKMLRRVPCELAPVH